MPKRKVIGKAGSNLRNVHNEQFTRIQFKHQVDVDLLEDIRNFTKLRASIEKDYGQALLKLSSNFLQRKTFTNPEKKGDMGEDNRLAYGVWKTLLDETEKLAKARLAAVEVYNTQISESAKAVRAAKLQVAKKYLDNMRRMQEELQVCVSEVDKTRKLYFDEEHMAHGAREKAHDAEEKLKRKKGRIFQSITALQKNSAKFSSRKEACDIQATKARNDYILALVAANAHQKRFYQTDLPEIIQSLDCGICDRVREYITLMARTELLTCTACQASYTKIQEEAERITGQFTLDCFLRENPVLGSMIQYDFEPCDGDEIEKVSIDHNALLCLQKEARKWSSCLTKELRTLRDCHKEMVKIQAQLASGEKCHKCGGPIDTPKKKELEICKIPQEKIRLWFNNQVDAVQGDGGQQMVDLETRLDEIKQIIRRAETSKAKAEARIEALREGGVNVEEWLKVVDQETLAAHEELCRKDSTSSVGSRVSARSEALEEQAQGSSEANDSMYDSDFNDGSSETSAAGHRRTSSLTDSANVQASDETDQPATVTSTYVAEAEDPLASVIQAWADDQQPTSEFPETVPPPEEQEAVQSEMTVFEYPPLIRCVALFNYQAVNSDELSFVEQEELEIIEDKEGDGWIKARNYRGEEGYIPQNYVEALDEREQKDQEQQGLSSFSSVDYTMPGEDDIRPPDTLDLKPEEEGVVITAEYCRALYDYEATCDEELSFLEGQVIRVLSRAVNEVDDGWWEGDIEGKTGLFPSLVVEELKWDGEPQTPQELTSPPGSAPPPAFTPPNPQFPLLAPAQVVLTEPTPEAENVPTEEENTEEKNKVTDVEGAEEDFQLQELPEQKKAQYQAQFPEEESKDHPPKEGEETIISQPEVSGDEACTFSAEEFVPPVQPPVEICIHSPDQPPRTGSDTEEEDEVEPEPPTNHVQETSTDESQTTETSVEDKDQSKDAAKSEEAKTEVEDPTMGTYQTAEEFERSMQEGESEDSITEVTVVEATSKRELSDSQMSDEIAEEVLQETPEKEAESKDVKDLTTKDPVVKDTAD